MSDVSVEPRRLDSVDVIRGVIMVLMALDHVNDFFGLRGVNPTNPATTTVGLFFTRWVTHFCAPVFFLLTGTGAFLSLRHKSKTELSRFLLTRGLWLIFLELVVLRCLAYQFNADYRVTMLLVLWALGWAMIMLSALTYLPTAVVTWIGIAMIAGHNLLDGVRLSNPLWIVLHRPGFVLQTPEHVVFAAYPLIPWIGVTAVGYGLGALFRAGRAGAPQMHSAPDRRRTRLLGMGLSLSTAFVVLRLLNVYGDPSQWAVQRSPLFTVLSFLNTTKYPPSLLFLLMTLGPALLFLRVMDRGVPRLLQPAAVIGRVPLFYYICHFSLIHLLAVAVGYARYGAVHWFMESPSLDRYPFTTPPGWGYPLAVVYAVWMLVVIALYPLCRWYSSKKAQSRAPWFSYL